MIEEIMRMGGGVNAAVAGGRGVAGDQIPRAAEAGGMAGDQIPPEDNMTNKILRRGVELIRKVISAPFKLGYWIIKWIGKQFVNLYDYFRNSVDA